MDDTTLIELVASFRAGILGGRSSRDMCFMVSAPLQSLLKFHGVPTELIETDLEDNSHFWLRLPDGRVLDPTLDQFSTTDRLFDAVYLGEPIPGIHIAKDGDSYRERRYLKTDLPGTESKS